MQISPPPIHPQKPKNSPPKDMANKVAETGSNENIRAVSVGFSIFCAHIMIRMAIKVAKTPVTKIAIKSRSDQIMVWVSRKKAFMMENRVTKLT